NTAESDRSIVGRSDAVAAAHKRKLQELAYVLLVVDYKYMLACHATVRCPSACPRVTIPHRRLGRPRAQALRYASKDVRVLHGSRVGGAPIRTSQRPSARASGKWWREPTKRHMRR